MKALTYVVAILSVVMVIFMLAVIFSRQYLTPLFEHHATKPIEYSEAAKMSIDLRTSAADRLNQLCLLGLGGVGALLFGKDGTRGVSDRAQWLLLISSCTALLCSTAFYFRWLQQTSEQAATLLQIHGSKVLAPNMASPDQLFLFQCQLWFAAFGILSLGVTYFVSGRLFVNRERAA